MNSFDSTMISICAALILDFLIGDPPLPFHPVRLIGKNALFYEKLFRSCCRPPLAGCLSWLSVMLTVTGCGFLLLKGLEHLFGQPGRITAGTLILWTSIAVRDLAVHAGRVRKALVKNNLEQARHAVAMMVGRDTDRLDKNGVARAAVESVAESYIDAAAAPLFWAILLGPLGALAFRCINTMDSLFGYKNDTYRDFGRCAARADDGAAFLPARLASFIVCLPAPFFGKKAGPALRIFFRYRLQHDSPNSAHGEAAFAAVLGLKLGGPSYYQETLLKKPWLGSSEEACKTDCSAADLGRAQILFILSVILWTVLLLGLRMAVRVLLS